MNLVTRLVIPSITAALIASSVATPAAATPAAPAPAGVADAKQSHTTAVGVHNGYQTATFPYLADALDSGAGLIEIDIWTDVWFRRWRVNHDLFGQSNNCTSGALRTGNRNQDFAACLANIKAWHDANPGHRPIVFKIEMKNGFDSRFGYGPADFDRLIAAKLGDAVYRPADLLAGGYPTLDAAALADNWPTRSELAGKVMFEVIPGTFERGNPFDHQYTDVEYAEYLRDLYAAGRIGSAQLFPAVLDAAAGDPRTRFSEPTFRPWFVFFDASATSYVGGGVDPAWYDDHHYQLIMVDAHAVAPPISNTNPTPQEASARVAQLARAHASYVTSDWSTLHGVLATVLPRG